MTSTADNNRMKRAQMECRPGCGACCIAPSISSPIPGMPEGKVAGVPCVNLDREYRCRIFGSQERPAVCGSLQPSPEMCGSCREEALANLARLEELTAPTAETTAPTAVAQEVHGTK